MLRMLWDLLRLQLCIASLFVPFQPAAENANDMLRAYAIWQNRVLHSTDIPCAEKQAIVYHSRAGIGDALSGLVGRFASAVQMGRLFLLGDISRIHWSIGVTNPLFDWNYKEAVDKGYICNVSSVSQQGYYGLQTSHILARESLPHIIIAYGHPTQATSLTQFYLSSSATAFSSLIQWEALVKQFLRPSHRVYNEKMKPMLEQIMSFATTNSDNNNDNNPKGNKRVLAMYIRVGDQERSRFLQVGDEKRFVHCVMKWLEKNSQNPGQQANHVLYISSDNFSVKNTVRAMLIESFPQLIILTLEEQGTSENFPHVSTAFPQSSEETALGSFADFFMMEYVDVLFRTQNSLFAGTAVELLGKPGLTWYVISSSTCDSNCNTPKFPSFCDEEPLPFHIRDL